MRQQFIDEILDGLKKLSFKKQVLFSYLACLRTYPNYEYFASEFKFGDPSVLVEGENYLLEFILDSKQISIEIIENIQLKIDKITPMPGNFNSIIASSALDATSCLYESLLFIIDKNINRLKDIVTLCLDTIDMFLVIKNNIDINSEGHEKIIYTHELMEREMKTQKGIVDFLKSTSNASLDDINLLIGHQKNERGMLGILK